MLSRIIDILTASPNDAADDALLEALRMGNSVERQRALMALIRRGSTRGLRGVVAAYDTLEQPQQEMVLANIRALHTALRECGRSGDAALATAAMRLIAIGRQGRLTYVLSENLHAEDETVSRVAAEAMTALARWVGAQSRRLQRAEARGADGEESLSDAQEDPSVIYRQLMEERPEIEQAVARAMEVHRGRHGQELLRAALLLADHPASRTLAILHTPRHGGQGAMIRRLQQPPDSEHVEAFLLAAARAGLRANFGVVFARIEQPPVLEALLRRTHWLKDLQLRLCMQQVTRCAWLDPEQLEGELRRRGPAELACAGEWITACGVDDAVQDDRLETLWRRLADEPGARLRLLRAAMRRPRGASAAFLRAMLSDPDERLARMAAREIARRRPPDCDRILLSAAGTAPLTVRRVIARSVGEIGFDNYWQRFDRMDRAAREAAGRALLKVLPDSLHKIERRMRIGPLEQRLKAITMAQELGAAETLAPTLIQLCRDPNPAVRSKAVTTLAGVRSVPADVVLAQALNDLDARVRANAIEVLEARRQEQYVPLLTQRARSSSNRERANAIKAMHAMRVATASTQLLNMLQDQRPEHRISALWALRQIGWWQMLREVARLASEDPVPRVRRYAAAVLRAAVGAVDRTDGRAAG